MAKPLGYPELRARIAALLRRSSPHRIGRLIRVGDLEIDTRARTARLGPEPIVLTQREYALLVHLAADPERVFTKQELLTSVWGHRSFAATRTLDSHACRLREKLSRTGRPRVDHQRVGRRLRPAPQPRRGGMRRTPLRPGLAPPGRRAPLARTPFAPASAAQREAVRGQPCLICGSPRAIDPAHLVPRSLGGCEHPLCVVALCRAHHRAYDRGELDLVPYLEPRHRAQAAHAVAHLGLIGALRRLGGDRGARMEHR